MRYTRWDVKRANMTSTGAPNATLRKLLVAGWEPFGTSGSAVYLRKRVRTR